jgi:DNA-binding HxlR family transcriptional regulator
MSKTTLTLTGRLSPRSSWQVQNCSIANALDVVGNRIAFLLLREAFYGTSRFDGFAQRVGISEPAAAARLKDLVSAGLLKRSSYREPGQRARLEYQLTEMGVDIFPVLVALAQWGDRWIGLAGAEMQHHNCGSEVRAHLRCDKGHSVEVGDVDLVSR